MMMMMGGVVLGILHRSCKKMTMEQACAAGRQICTPSLVTLRNYLEFEVKTDQKRMWWFVGKKPK